MNIFNKIISDIALVAFTFSTVAQAQNNKVNNRKDKKELNKESLKLQKKRGQDQAMEYKEIAKQEAEWHKEKAELQLKESAN